jgi:amino acid transporter
MPLWTIYILGVVTLIVLASQIPYDRAFKPDHRIADPAVISIDLLKDISSLMTTVDTAMLGGASFLLFDKSGLSKRQNRLINFVLISVFLAGAVTYFGVYYLDITILLMVDSKFLSMSMGVYIGLRLEYGGIGLGVFLLGLALSLMLGGNGGNAVT